MDEAKELGASLLRDLRYGEAGYFWADTYDGNCVVLLGNETEGTNRMETKDANGYEMVREIIRVGQEPDGGFVDYMFPKAGETEPSPKRSYSKAFEPFGWVIGTGNYTDYIDTTVALQTKNLSQKIKTTILMVLGTELVILAISLCLSLYIGNSLSKSFNASLKYIGNMAKGNFSEPLPELLQNRKDDFGILSEGLENMKHQVSSLIREVKNQGNLLYGIVDRVKDNVSSLSGNVEDVSATTQQLAAGMEETAASSETISNMSHEIEIAAKNIAFRSQEGAEQAVDIHERASKAQEDTKNQRTHAYQIHNELQESLAKALEDAKAALQKETDNYKKEADKLSALRVNVAKIKNSGNVLNEKLNYDSLDAIFKEIVEGYYVSNILEQGATDVRVIPAKDVKDENATKRSDYFVKFTSDSKNYALVEYKINGKTKTVKLNYKPDGFENIIIFEKDEN